MQKKISDTHTPHSLETIISNETKIQMDVVDNFISKSTEIIIPNETETLKDTEIIAKKGIIGSILWNLLGVSVILGGLFALILPNLLGCGGSSPKPKASEARSLIGVVNRSQQVYFLENQRFASNFEELEFSKADLSYYDLTILKNGIVLAKGVDNPGNRTRDYIGGVSYDLDTKTFSSLLCQANQSSNYSISNPSKAIINAGKVHHSQIKCGVGVDKVN